MPRHILVASLMAVRAMAQANFATKDFQYIGCIEASPQAFPVKMDLVAGFTVRSCQDECAAKQAHAAAAADGCYCQTTLSEPASDFVKQDDSKCSNPCKPNDPKGGNCGGPVVNVGKKLYSVYQRTQENSEIGEAKSVTDNIGSPNDGHPSFFKAESPLPPSDENEPSPQPPPSKSCGCSLAATSPVSSAMPRPQPTCDGPGCPCIGSECFRTSKTDVLRPPTSSPLPASTSNVVQVSEGPPLPASAVMAVLAASIVLAVGMS